MDLYHCIDAKEDITQVHPNADIMFKEAPMTFMGFREEMTRIFESFPDFKLNLVRPLKEQPDGRVEATLFATGTHVGKPYSFGPFPEIAPTGIAIKLEPEYVDDGVNSKQGQNSPHHTTAENVFTQSEMGKSSK